MRDDSSLDRLTAQVRSKNRSDLLPIRAEGLCLDHDGAALLGPIDLTLQAGRITMIMGFNGAGKSLLLHLLHGLRRPTGGTIHCGAASAPLPDAMRRRQAMVFQKPVLLRRSVAANIDFALRTRKHRDIAQRRDALLAHVGLSHRAQHPARRLSGGEQQRLALARALATDPEVLFLDEPTASLDPASVNTIEEVVLAAHDAGTKIVFVTHDIGQARRLGDEIVFLHEGRVVEQAPGPSFFAAPRSEPARAYLDGRLPL